MQRVSVSHLRYSAVVVDLIDGTSGLRVMKKNTQQPADGDPTMNLRVMRAQDPTIGLRVMRNDPFMNLRVMRASAQNGQRNAKLLELQLSIIKL